MSITCDKCKKEIKQMHDNAITSQKIAQHAITAYSISVGLIADKHYHLYDFIPKADFEGELMGLRLATGEWISFIADHKLNWIMRK